MNFQLQSKRSPVQTPVPSFFTSFRFYWKLILLTSDVIFDNFLIIYNDYQYFPTNYQYFWEPVLDQNECEKVDVDEKILIGKIDGC